MEVKSRFYCKLVVFRVVSINGGRNLRWNLLEKTRLKTSSWEGSILFIFAFFKQTRTCFPRKTHGDIFYIFIFLRSGKFRIATIGQNPVNNLSRPIAIRGKINKWFMATSSYITFLFSPLHCVVRSFLDSTSSQLQEVSVQNGTPIAKMVPLPDSFVEQQEF